MTPKHRENGLSIYDDEDVIKEPITSVKTNLDGLLNESAKMMPMDNKRKKVSASKDGGEDSYNS